MKRYILIAFAFFILCTGCSTEKLYDFLTYNQHDVFPPATPTTIAPSEPTTAPIIDLGITSDDVVDLYNKLTSSSAEAKSTIVDNVEICFWDLDDARVLCYKDIEFSNVFCILMIMKNQYFKVDTDSLFQEIQNTLLENIPHASSDSLTLHDRHAYVVFASGYSFDLDDLPCQEIQLIAPDFFSDDERKSDFHDHLYNMDWPAMLELLNMYISDCSPADDDIAFAMQDVLTSSLSTWEHCNHTYDTVEHEATLADPDIFKLSSSANIAPTLENGDFILRMGFYADSWLFFDKIIISADGETVYSENFKSYDIEREVYDDASISESTYTNYTHDDYVMIGTAEEVIIRFKNSDTDEALDFILSDEEITAFSNIYQLWVAHDTLADAYYDSTPSF